MDDNATCHQPLAVQDCLDSEGIQRRVWPKRSPDLNPIENVWDALGRQVAGRNYPPTNKNSLIRALTEEWDKLSQQLLDNVVQTTFAQIVRPGHQHSLVDAVTSLSYLTRDRLERDIVFSEWPKKCLASYRHKKGVRKGYRVGLSTADTDGRKIVGRLQKKSGVLAISAEVSTTRVVKSSIASPSVYHT
ncbi:transposable element Tcb2 transposase [Trichonephila clavipes]|nr:transposable element Tcb2 transposase [Trichonephila clavipes]